MGIDTLLKVLLVCAVAAVVSAAVWVVAGVGSNIMAPTVAGVAGVQTGYYTQYRDQEYVPGALGADAEFSPSDFVGYASSLLYPSAPAAGWGTDNRQWIVGLLALVPGAMLTFLASKYLIAMLLGG